MSQGMLRMECRDWVMRTCCGAEGTCRYRVTVDPARLSQCLREMERSYDCNRLYTPACFELTNEGEPPGSRSEPEPQSE